MKPLQAQTGSPLWPLLGLFLLINTLLSYVPLSLVNRVILMALLVPLLFLDLKADWIKFDSPTHSSPSGEFHPPIWVWMVFGLLALVLRFGMLKNFLGWPGGDDALQGLFALDLDRHWIWRMFYTTGQHPPLWNWLLSLLYRICDDSAFNLWFLPALVSSLFVGVSVLAARRVFPNGAAFPLFLALGFGFWPLLFGRYCVQADLVPLFEAIAVLCLTGLWVAKKGFSQTAWAVMLGLCVGVGAYSYTGFLSVLIASSLAVLAWAWGKKDRNLPALLYLLTLLILICPLSWAATREHVGGYLLSTIPWGGIYHWKDMALHAASYITALFWGPLGTGADYGPVWGGFLNPVETAFFLLGIRTIRNWKSSQAQWLLGGVFLLFLLPGLLTADLVEMLRVIPMMPLLYLVCCFGFLRLWQGFGRGRAKAVLIILAIISLFLNLFHLAKVRSWDGPLTQKFSYQERTNDGYWAYRRLAETAQAQGPGLVFSDFLLLDRDHSLHVMSYPFNALLNPRLDASRAQWAGLLTNVHYGAFLKERFPRSHWEYVTPPKNPVRGIDDGGAVVGIIPITSENRKVFTQWTQAHEYYRGLSLEAENAMNDQDLYARQVERLPAGYSLMEGDKFLESVYGEWVAQYHIGPSLDPNVQAIRRALQKGYPAANLYFKLGNFLAAENKRAEAEQAFAQALKCQPNHTQALLYLKSLMDQMESPKIK